MMNIKDLSFSYGSTKILDDISFDASDNKIISILGPNGTGKTTLLKCICNIHRPEGGEILIDGTNVLDLKGKELATHIGYVPQNSPASRMSVFDLILLGRKPHIDWFVTKTDIDKVSDIIDELDMSHLSFRYLDEVSGGELQKAQIARAIVQEPKLLILDEPTNNLDISNQHITMHMIEDVVRSKNMCTIMTMHDINLAVHYSDLFLFLKNGGIAAYGGLEVITTDLIQEVYGMETEIIYHRDVPLVVPTHSSKYSKVFFHDHPHR